MFAIIRTGGKQYKVSSGQKIKVEKLNAKEGKEIVLGDVLLVAKDDSEIRIGTPKVKGAKVKAKVLKHIKGKKIVIFKYKAKKRYKKKQGHRQQYTEVEIKEITG